MKIIDHSKPKTGVIDEEETKGLPYWWVQWHYYPKTKVYKYSYDKKRYEVVK